MHSIFIAVVVLALQTGSCLARLDDSTDGTSNMTVNAPGCLSPYVTVGDKCFLFVTIRGYWDELRTLCQQLGGDLAKVDANTLNDIVDYIHVHGLDESVFWLGGSDIEEEGRWVWTDGTPVRMGTPCWDAENLIQQPQGGTKQNCLFISNTHLYFFDDGECATMSGAICEYIPQ